MPITVRAPDGTLVNFPDGMSDGDITRVMRKNYPPSSAAAPKPKPKKKEEEPFYSGILPTLQSATGKVISTSGELMQQFAPILGRLSNAGAPGIALAGALGREYGKGITAGGEAKLPEASLAERRRQQADIANAKPGTGSEILAGIGRATASYADIFRPELSGYAREFLPQTPERAAPVLAAVQAPFQTARGASEFVASQLPASLIPLGGGKAVQLARGAFLPAAGREAAKALLAKEVGTGVVATGGVINAAAAGSQAREDVLNKGGTQEEADRAFKIAAAGAGLVSGAAARMPGLEQLAFAEKPARGGILRSAGRAVIGEAPQEFVEEGGATLATNVAKLGTAAEVPIGEDVLSSGALGAIGGGIIAAPIGGLQGLANRGATDDGTPPPPASSRPSRPSAPPPAPPADMEALARSLGPVGGKVTLQEPTGPREYTFEGIDEDGSVVLADADGVIFSEDPAQVQAAIKAGAVAPESGLGGMSFGDDITEGLDDVVAPPPPPPPPSRIVEYVEPAPKPAPKPKFTIETAEEEAAREAEAEAPAPSKFTIEPVPVAAPQSGIADWDLQNRSNRSETLFEGDVTTRQTRAQAVADYGNRAVHGLSKAGTATQAYNDVVNILENGINPERGGGALYTGPLDATTNSGAGVGTASGTAYFDGPFALVGRDGHVGQFTSADQIAGILVNDALANTNAVEDLRQRFPNLAVETYSNAGNLLAQTQAAPTPPPPPPPAAPRAVGKSARVTIPVNRQKFDVQYELQDLDNIKFAQDELQNRDRSRPASDAFVTDTVNNFDPEGFGEDRYTDRGAPIINKDNTILSGNGRTQVLQEIYDFNPDKAEIYKESLREQGYDIEGIERPVLVRRLMSDADERKFVTASNEPDIAALSPPEQAAQDASDILTPGVFAKFKGGDLDAKKNDAFVSAFLAEMSSQGRKNAMDDKGKISAQGLKRIENALLYKAYGDNSRASKIFISKAMERNDDDTKTLTNSLVDVSKDWINFQQAIEAGEIDKKYNITNKLMETIGTASDIKASGNSVAFELRSPDMVEPMDPFVREILLAFHNDDVSRILSRKAIAEKLKAYTEVAAVQQAEPDMLGMSETPSARDIWRRIDKGEGAPQSDLYASIEAPRDVSQQDIEEIRKVPSLKRGLAKLIKYKDEQLIDDAEFAEQVTRLKDYVDRMLDEKADRIAAKGRARGADRVLSEMLKARRAGNIDPDSVDFMTWALKGNPSLADGLAISILTPKEKSPAGKYDDVTNVMILFKGRASDTTAVHELLHHTERMMPEDIQRAIRVSWLRAFNKQAERSKDNILEKEFFKNLRAFHSGNQVKMGKETYSPRKGMELALRSISKGYVPYSFYQYVNPSEFWAVNATEIMQKRFGVSDSILGRLRNWLSEFVERAKGLFNLSAKSPLLRALDSLAKADGKFNSQEMLDQEATEYMDVTPIDEKRAEKEFKELKALVDDLAKAMEQESFGIPQMQRRIVGALDEALNSLDGISDNAPPEFDRKIESLERKIQNLKAIAGASLKPANENKLETEVQKAERELEVATQAVYKAFDDDRAYMDRRTKERKAYEKELDQLEKVKDEAFAKWDKLYRKEADSIMMALTNGTPDQMRNAVAKAQKPNDKVIDQGADLQKENRGCD